MTGLVAAVHSTAGALTVIGWLAALVGLCAAGWLIYRGAVIAGLALGGLVIVAAILLL